VIFVVLTFSRKNNFINVAIKYSFEFKKKIFLFWLDKEQEENVNNFGFMFLEYKS
jgi:hypothetical protein